MCVIFRRITCRGHVGTLASIYGVGGWSRYIRSDRVEYLVLLCPSTPPRFHLCPSFSSTRPPPPLSLRFASPFSHYLLAYAFSSASLSLSLCTLSFPPLRSIVSSRERERGGSLSIVVSRIFSFSRQRLAPTERTEVEKVDRTGREITREREKGREGGRKVGKEASRIILRMGGA